MKRIVLLDTWTNNANLGNKIIFESVSSILRDIFPSSFIYQVSALECVQAGKDLLEKADLIFLAGTNQLSSNMDQTSEWCAEPDEVFWGNKVILLGVGWWQYQEFLPNEYTQRLLRNVLSHRHYHSVRDSYTSKRLQNLGFKAFNTGCPTFWSLTSEHCKTIKHSKSDSAVLTFTEYNQNPEFDRALFKRVQDNYSKIYFWPQQYLDYFYAQEICGNQVEFVNPSTEAFDKLLVNEEIDYIGTRLHAGIRALQKGRRTIIISVDNRAQEIGKDFKLPIILRENIVSQLDELIHSSWKTQVNIDEHSNHKEWLNQFQIENLEENKIISRQPVYVGRWFINHSKKLSQSNPLNDSDKDQQEIQKLLQKLALVRNETSILREENDRLSQKVSKNREILKKTRLKVKALKNELDEYQEFRENLKCNSQVSSDTFFRKSTKIISSFFERFYSSSSTLLPNSTQENLTSDLSPGNDSLYVSYAESSKDYSQLTKESIITSVIDNALTYLDFPALEELYDQVARLENSNIDGMLIEAGCALGGSAIVIAAAKSKSRLLSIYDVFGMIPPPSQQDGQDVHDRYEIIQSGQSDGIHGQKYYGYENDLLQKVRSNFKTLGFPLKKNRIQLIQGLFQDTLHPVQNVALAHIDGDWYDSVKICLERIEPQLISGGVLVVDDYYQWSGCRKAVDEYFRSRDDLYEFVQKSRLHIIRR